MLSVRDGNVALRRRWCTPQLQNSSLHDITLPASTQHCNEEFSGTRCGQCATGFYRFGSGCNSCSDQAHVTVALAVTALVAATVSAWLLTRRKLSMVLFTIAVDFFQILGRQAAVNIQWGDGTRAALSWTNAFDFNVELLAPECVANIEYGATWGITMMLPLVLLLVLLCVHVVKVWRGDRQTEAAKHPILSFLPQVLLLCQMLYIVLCEKSFEVLDCITLPDGAMVLEANPRMTCWEGEHVALAAGGAAGVLVYVFGIPAFFWRCMVLARRNTCTDKAVWQRAVAPITARFRSNHQQWMLLIMARKFALAATGILNSTRPGFQLAFASAILCGSLSLQASVRPYRNLSRDYRTNTANEKPWHVAWRKIALSANLLEEVALLSSFAVVFGGLLFLTGYPATLDGTLQPSTIEVVDVIVATVVVVSTLWVFISLGLFTWRGNHIRQVTPLDPKHKYSAENEQKNVRIQDNPLFGRDMASVRTVPHSSIRGTRVVPLQ